MGAGSWDIAESFRCWHGSGLSHIVHVQGDEDWPEPWDRYWSKAQPARMVWTYPELGQDLLGQGDSLRRGLLAGLIKELAFPKGWITFWPVSGPDGHFQRALFTRGVERLSAELVLFFGEASSFPFALHDEHAMVCPTQSSCCSRLRIVPSLTSELIVPECAQLIREYTLAL